MMLMPGVPETLDLDSNQTLIFLHLMKTGGRTLTRLLKQQYDASERFHCGKREQQTAEYWQSLSDEEKRSLQFIYGHLDFGLHQYLPQSSAYITLLRNPVERVISHYYYAFYTPKHYTHKLVKSQNMGLADYVSHGPGAIFDNEQTRRIAGKVSRNYAFGNASPELLELAKQNIKSHFLFVGITERFDESILLLKEYVGLERFLYIKSNVNSSKPSLTTISDADIAAIKQYNQLDLELYDFANQCLDEQIAQQGALFQTKLELFQEFNQQYSDLQKTRTQTVANLKKSQANLRNMRANREQFRTQMNQVEQAHEAANHKPLGKLWQRLYKIKRSLTNAKANS